MTPRFPERPGPGSLLAIAALTAAVTAALSGAGDAGAPGGDGPAELTPELASGAAYVDARELARMIRERRPVRIVDVRDSSEFVRFSLPTSTHATLPGLAELDADEGEGPIVVYDDGGGDAVRAWLLLRRLGHPDVRILHDGVLGWLDDVLSPVLPAGTAEERARFDRVAELSRYFGGMPRVGEPPPRTAAHPARAEEAINLISRRGCY